MSFIASAAVIGVAGAGADLINGNNQADASRQAGALSGHQYQQTRNDLAPYRAIGGQAINALGSIYGYSPAGQGSAHEAGSGAFSAKDINKMLKRGMSIDQILELGTLRTTGGKQVNYLTKHGVSADDIKRLSQGIFSTPAAGPSAGGSPTGSPGSADYSNFYKSPDYQFRRDEGQRDLGGSFAARGGAASGNALKALSEYNSNLAAGEFGNYFNRQLQLAGVGQNAVNTGAGYGAQNAANQGNALVGAADARASGLSGAVGDISGLVGYLSGKYTGKTKRQPAYNYGLPAGWS